jgi:Dolichyl-phosphate-mannose-protein mannosyltransferase
MATQNTTVTASNHPRTSIDRGMAIIWAIAVAKLLFHVYFNNRYGYFRDEFDYLSCGDHLQWGYVDQPPLVPFLTHVSRAVLGESLRAIRFLPALASAFLIVQTAWIVRELGGKTYALVLSAICILIAPQYLSNGSLLTTNYLEPTLWMACAYSVIRAIKRNNPRYWLWFGVFAGLGLEEKYSILLFGFGIVVGLLLTRERRIFLTKWIWIAGAISLAIFLPNLLWNIHYHWPFVQLMHNIRADQRDVVLSAGEYFLQQALLIHPLTAPIWIIGLLAFLFSSRLKPYRLLGICYLVCYGVFFTLHGKVYYLAPIYPMLLAAGAVVVESALSRRRLTWLKPAIAVLLLASGAHIAPMVVPVLSPDGFLNYLQYLPMKPPTMEHAHARAALPQWYSDQFGWNEIVAETAVAWNQIPVEERHDCAIFAQDYGQAGAIDFLGRRYGLPRAISGHQTWFLWGSRGYSGNCMIVLDDNRETLERLFNDVKFVGTSADNPYALEKQIPVFICHGMKNGTLTEHWPHLEKWR